MVTTIRRPSRSRQRGQAMTEFVVGAVFFLLPLFLIIPTLGKYADVKNASGQVARYVAWERTVWYGGASASSSSDWPGNHKAESTIQNEARQRIVLMDTSSATAPFKSADGSASSFSVAGARQIWHNRDSSNMLQSYNDAQTGAISNDNAPGVLGSILGGALSVTNNISFFKLEGNGFYTGRAALAVKTLPIGGTLRNVGTDGVFDPGVRFGESGKLVFRDQNALLANGWSARGTAHVRSQVMGLTPLGFMSDPTVRTITQTVGCIALALFVPEICGLEPGKIAPDIVPPDRLTGG
ncbi:MAG: hypothetical protein J0H69_08205 [Burkholderiales bacterium]|nr:hypothetical protein [Burkholderiales bacterium]